jgi:hypothetical protein
MFIWDFLVWIFETGLLVGFAMLVVYSTMFTIEYYPAIKKWVTEHYILYIFKKVYLPSYKQTNSIITEIMCQLHRRNARVFIVLSYINALIVVILAAHDMTAYLNLVLMLLFLILAAAHEKVLGRYKQDVWEAACNPPMENKHEKNYIKKRK